MEANVLNFNKEVKSKITLDPLVFDLDFDINFISSYFAKMKKKSFVKTAKTKNRSEVSGTTKKPHKQKHTGNARLGSLKSAQCIGGGIVFGPRGISRFIKLPKKESALAKKMILSMLFKQNRLFFVENESLSSYSTKTAKSIFSSFGKKVLVVHFQNVSDITLLSTRNMKSVSYVSFNALTVFDLMNNDTVLLDQKIIQNISEQLYA